MRKAKSRIGRRKEVSQSCDAGNQFSRFMDVNSTITGRHTNFSHTSKHLSKNEITRRSPKGGAMGLPLRTGRAPIVTQTQSLY